MKIRTMQTFARLIHRAKQPLNQQAVNGQPPNRSMRRLRGTAIAAVGCLSLVGGVIPPGMSPSHATSRPSVQQQQDWRASLHVARWTSRNQLVVQLNVVDKPITRYANAVYMVQARKGNRWVQIFTSTGARLITSANGQVTLAPEVIDCDALSRSLGMDLSRTELRVIAMLRYDTRSQRDLTVQFEQTQRYVEIAQTTTTQIATNPFMAPPRPISPRPVDDGRRDQSRFSLSILQRQSSLSHVVARVSLKERLNSSFRDEQFVGDFRYKLKDKKNKARFIKGVKAGDRVVIRLFDKQERFIGYSEFEVLSQNTAVTLVLPERSRDYGIVRTIYGIDANQDNSIDRNVAVYDYFTQVTQVQNYRRSQVTFFSSTQSIDLNSFSLAGLPVPRPNCLYPASFQTGQFMLINQVFSAFSSSLTATLVSIPGRLVSVIDLNSSMEYSTYEVNQLLTDYRVVTRDVSVGGNDRDDDDRDDDDDDDDDDDRKRRKGRRQCNQGRGNGSEGCDPGNSRPRGGSNDGDDDDDD
jgi:hypothetical protein